MAITLVNRDNWMEAIVQEIIRRRNSSLNQKEFIQKRISLTSRPRIVFLELTRRCNLRCRMCREANPHIQILDMKDSVLSRVFQELVPYVEAVDLRGDGESSLDPRLKELIVTLTQAGIRTHLYTNLTTHDPEYWKEIGQDDDSNGPKKIQNS